MSLILSAKPVVEALKNSIREQAAALRENGVIPTLGIIRVGERPDDVSYENSIIKNCQSVGIEARQFTFPADITYDEFAKNLQNISDSPDIHGILMFRPLPAHLRENTIRNLLDPGKDIDGMNPVNLAKVFEGGDSGFVPCTPAAVMATLKHYNIPLQGSNAVVIGRSLVVGKPLSMMLLKENATVTVCHSRSRNLPEITRRADILIAALGKAGAVTADYVGAQAVVVDVGINDAGDGKVCGDVDYEKVADRVRAITPVPGGIGSVTTAILLSHVIKACTALHKKL